MSKKRYAPLIIFYTKVASLCRTGLLDKQTHAYTAQVCIQLLGLWLTKRNAQLCAQYWCLARTTIPGRAKYSRIRNRFRTTFKQVQHRHGLMCSTKNTYPRVSSLQYSWSMLFNSSVGLLLHARQWNALRLQRVRFRENLDPKAVQSVKTPVFWFHMVKFLVRLIVSIVCFFVWLCLVCLPAE